MVTLSFPTLNTLRIADGGDLSVIHPLERVVAGAAVAGFAHVGVDAVSVRDAHQRGVAREAIRGLLDTHGVTCAEVGVLVVGDPDRTVSDAADLGHLASTLGAMLCTTAMQVPPDRRAIRTLQACAEILAARGVRMALEFVPYTPLHTLEDARRVCEAVGWGRCGVLVDAWMFHHGDNTFAELASLPSAHIAYVQFDDAPPPVGDDLRFESRHRRVLPGEGRLDLHRFTEVVLTGGFDGVVSIEVLSDALRAISPAEQARLTRAAAAPYWS